LRRGLIFLIVAAILIATVAVRNNIGRRKRKTAYAIVLSAYS